MANYGYFEGYTGIYKYTFNYIDDKFESVAVDFSEGHYSISVSYPSDSYITIYEGNYRKNYNADINNNGYITCLNDRYYSGSTLYSYDSEGYLTNESCMYEIYNYIDESNTAITWDNGNIVKTRSEFYDLDEINTWKKTYKYNNKLTKLVNLDLNWFVNPMDEYCIDIDYIIGTAGFMGTKCKNYMIEQKYDSGSTIKYDWTYDDLGYPIKCVVTDYIGDASSVSTYTFAYMD